VIPEVAPNHVKITGVNDVENDEPIKFQADLTSPVEIPGVDTAQQTIEINDLDFFSATRASFDRASQA
jgi:hypothetical protein